MHIRAICQFVAAELRELQQHNGCKIEAIWRHCNNEIYNKYKQHKKEQLILIVFSYFLIK